VVPVLGLLLLQVLELVVQFELALVQVLELV
jgi:hypothetical protein